MKYAGSTVVTVEQTKGEIIALLARYGADGVHTARRGTVTLLQWYWHGEKMGLQFEEPQHEQALRALWRSVKVAVHGLMEAAVNGISPTGPTVKVPDPVPAFPPHVPKELTTPSPRSIVAASRESSKMLKLAGRLRK